MPSVAIHVIYHSVHRSHKRWYFVSRGFRDAVLLYYYWSCPYSPIIIAEYVSTSYILHFVRANYSATGGKRPFLIPSIYIQLVQPYKHHAELEFLCTKAPEPEPQNTKARI